MRALVVALALAVPVSACGSGPPAPSAEPPARVAADVIQLRRDQVLQRVQVALGNRGRTDLFVETVRLEVPGFDIPGPVRKDAPIPAGQVVNLPVPFDGVDCPGGDSPDVGAPVVTLRAKVDGRLRTIRFTARDADGLLQRIADRSCAVERVLRDVELRFADRWRLVRTPQGPQVRGELLARWRTGPSREITDVAGAIMYGLEATGEPAPPLAEIGPGTPTARIPVAAWAARCDPHTIGEIKKPYEFLVWVTTPGGEELAVTPTVGEATKAALRKVCAF